MSQILHQCKADRLYWLQWHCVNSYLPYRLYVLILVSGFLQVEKRNQNNWEKQKSESMSQMFHWSSNTSFTLFLFYSPIFSAFSYVPPQIRICRILYELFIMPGSEREGITLGLAILLHLFSKTPEQWC